MPANRCSPYRSGASRCSPWSPLVRRPAACSWVAPPEPLDSCWYSVSPAPASSCTSRGAAGDHPDGAAREQLSLEQATIRTYLRLSQVLGGENGPSLAP